MITRQRIFEIIEKTNNGGRAGIVVEWVLIILIWLNVAAVVLGSIEELFNKYNAIFISFEFFSIVIFTAEYALRLWTAPNKFNLPKNSLRSYLRYIFSFLGIIDLFAILPFYFPFIIDADLRILRVLRTFRLLRILKLSRYNNSFKMIIRVLREQKEKLFITLFFIVVMILLSSSIMYFVETAVQPDKFPNIPATLWWAVATLTTVGYGDVYPITILGKILGSFIAVMGIGLIAMPSGIISAGLIKEVKKQKSEKQCPFCGRKI